MTALYDAIGETLTNYENESDNIMVILTDGEENSSRKWTQKMVQDKISKFTDEKGWIFHYLGANQDAWAVGSSIGIRDKKFTTTYSADDGGFDHAFAQNSAQTKGYRGVQARKKKGMFVPSLEQMNVPVIDKSAYLSSKSMVNASKNVDSKNVSSVGDKGNNVLNASAVNHVSAPVQERTLFNSEGGALFGNQSNAMPKMNKMKKKSIRQRPMLQQNQVQQRNMVPQQNIFQQQQMPIQQQMQQQIQQQMPIQQQMSNSIPIEQLNLEPEMETGLEIQQVIQESQQNRHQTQQDFNQLYQNSDADMQAALRNSLNE